MNHPDPPLSSDDTLEILLDEWEEAVERGERPDLEQYCARYPHLADEFRAKTEMLAKLNGQLDEQMADTYVPQGPRKGPESAPCSAIDWRCHVGKLDYHAHGGLGIVFRGFDQNLHRDVAVKFIRERRRMNIEDLQRFRIEAEITSRLDHPGVAPVHGYGKTENGVPFYSMRMVEGQTLQERIDEYHKRLRKEADPSDSSVEFRKLLSSFVSVCNTIEYAHNRGIINCDVKPGNVMLGKYGETIVLDWGCAKYVGSAGKAESVGEESLKPLSNTNDSDPSALTGGTPIYMSPEQHAQSEEIGPSTDIYSLGVTLYRIVTGQPAFSPESSLPKIREQVLRGKFRKPNDVCPWVSKALEAICMKAMALSPEDRYASAADLARDIERYLADEEVAAYSEPISRRMARLMRRHRGVSQVLMLSVLLFIVVSSVFAVVMGRMASLEANARENATEMRNRSLQFAARSAATSMALKINDAWRILEIESNSQLLRNELETIQGSSSNADWKTVQEWLIRRAQQNERSTEALSWFLCKADGTQVARFPLIDEETDDVYDSIGRNFAFRDYFRGSGAGRNGTPHITDVHLSAVYQSSNTANLKVAFSIPIWSEKTEDGGKEFLGVLGYSVELGRFAVLQDAEESHTMHQNAVLVDMRTSDPQDETDLYGVVLQHQLMEDFIESLPPNLELLPKLTDETLETLEEYRKQRIEQIRRAGFAASTGDVLLVSDFQDPFELGATGSIVAACEPVCVVGRSEEGVVDTGWVVIIEEFVKERPESAR